jgi:hypothetical protein
MHTMSCEIEMDGQLVGVLQRTGTNYLGLAPIAGFMRLTKVCFTPYAPD